MLFFFCLFLLVFEASCNECFSAVNVCEKIRDKSLSCFAKYFKMYHHNGSKSRSLRFVQKSESKAFSHNRRHCLSCVDVKGRGLSGLALSIHTQEEDALWTDSIKNTIQAKWTVCSRKPLTDTPTFILTQSFWIFSQII